jgi:DnaJ family protein C protein 2
MLALPLSDSTLDSTNGKVLSSFTLHPQYVRRIEPAGCKFSEFYREKVLKYNTTQDSSDEEETKGEDFSKDQIKDWEKKRHKKTQDQLNKEKLLEENYYAILGIGDLGMGSSESDIKKAYRKMALIYHPDKNDKSTTEDLNPIWLKIQKAYETLTDPEKRKKYDSTLPFEEAIPEDPVDEKDFYSTFGPVFIRNSLWSVKRPVPDIGNENTNIKQVNKFYEFWEKFDSWRDFSVFDEYNLDEAESRYERRYMERENKRIKAEHLKKERQRIFNLVENARK